jgi:hypothetical protein
MMIGALAVATRWLRDHLGSAGFVLNATAVGDMETVFARLIEERAGAIK